MAVHQSYPERLELGMGAHRTTFVLRRAHLLVAFVAGTSAADMDRVLLEPDIAPYRPLYGEYFRDRVQASYRRWVAVPSGLERQVARRLLTTFRAIARLASPLYAPADTPDDESTFIAADPEHLTVLAEAGAVEALVGMGLVLDEDRSRLLAPFSRFRLGPHMIADDGFDLLDRIQAMPDVRCAELNWITLNSWQQGLAPDYTYWDKQWNLKRIGLPAAWSLAQGRSEVVIAVIDSGFDVCHADMKGVFTDLACRRNFIPTPPTTDVTVPAGSPFNDWHGTAVAGVIGAGLNPAGGVAGVASGCRILPIRVADGDDGDVGCAIAWAIQQGATVINLSQSVGSRISSTAYQIEQALAADIVICAAAGNGWPGSQVGVCFPACHQDVIAVGASDQNDFYKDLAPDDQTVEQWFSQYGAELDVVAPGVWIPTIDYGAALGYNSGGGKQSVCWYGRLYKGAEVGDDQPGDYLFVFTGTSAAAAQVSGLAALIRSKYPNLDRTGVRDRIEKSCEKIGGYVYDPAVLGRPNGGWYVKLGYGLIRCDRALK